MARFVAIKLAEQNLRVRVCVQGSMGVGIFKGLPKQLSGVATLLQRMDWQSGEGEENEGMVGNFVNFGEVGKDHVVNAHIDADGKKVEQDDVFILLCPQSSVGVASSIIGPLQDMVEAAGDRPIILLNPDLVDRPSAQGQQSVRGRKERIEFAESFETVFHFANLYVSGTSYFPILGSLTKLKPSVPWVAHQRRDRLGEKGEVYVPVVSGDARPDSEVIKQSLAN
jgi:adenylate kinase